MAANGNYFQNTYWPRTYLYWPLGYFAILLGILAYALGRVRIFLMARGQARWL